MKWYALAFEKAGDFKSRSRRQEYWMFALFNFLFIIVAVILDNLIGINFRGTFYGPVYVLYSLVALVPGLALAVRRLHDTGKSGWNILWSLIPLIGSIYLIVLLLTDSTSGDNQYGPNPKGIDGAHSGNNTVTDNPQADAIITGVVVWMVLTRLFWLVIPKLLEEYVTIEVYRVVDGLLGFVWGLIPIALAFTMRDKKKRVIVFVLGGIYLLFHLYGIVRQIIEAYS